MGRVNSYQRVRYARSLGCDSVDGTQFSWFRDAKLPAHLNALRQEMTKRPEVFVGVLAERMLTYGVGRGLEYYDMPAVRKIVQDARSTNYRFSSIVLGVVRSVPFQMKETAVTGKETR